MKFIWRNLLVLDSAIALRNDVLESAAARDHGKHVLLHIEEQ